MDLPEIRWSAPDSEGISTAIVLDEGVQATEWAQGEHGWSWPVGPGDEAAHADCIEPHWDATGELVDCDGQPL